MNNNTMQPYNMDKDFLNFIKHLELLELLVDYDDDFLRVLDALHECGGIAQNLMHYKYLCIDYLNETYGAPQQAINKLNAFFEMHTMLIGGWKDEM